MKRSRSLEKLGTSIRRLRVAAGLSQEKLGFMTGLHRTYLGGVERGERNIGFLNLLRIARALNVKVEDVVRGISVDSTSR